MILLASYNIRKGIGTDRRRRPERVVEVLREVDADVIALQEADRRFGLKQSAIPLELIEHSPWVPVPFGVRPGGLGWHGNALLIRKSAELLDRCILELPTLEPRGAVMAEIRVHGEELRVIGMHLDLSGLWRRRQVRSLLTQLRTRHRKLPTVLMGDLNEWSPHGGCLREFGHDHRIAPTGRSYHSRHPLAALDRIIYSPDLSVVASGVHHSEKAGRASDHLPIWARVRPRL